MNPKQLAAVVVVAFVSGFLGSQTHATASASDCPQGTICGQAIRLTDSHGNRRMTVAFTETNQTVAMSMFAPGNPTARIIIGIRPDDAAAIELRDPNGSLRAELLSDANGLTRLNIPGQNRLGGLVLGTTGNQTALVLNDDQPKHRAVLELDASGDPALAMYDKDGNKTFPRANPAPQ